MATKVTVGGRDYLVQPLVFATLENVWPRLLVVQELVKESKAGGVIDAVKMMNHAVAFIALAMLQDSDELKALIADEKYAGMTDAEKHQIVISHIKHRISSVEVQALEPAINAIMAEAGFEAQEPQKGEAEVSPSMATGTHSSPSSSPQDAKEAAGT